MRRPPIRSLVAIGAALLLVGLLAFLLAPDPIAVDTAVIKRGPMVVTVSSEGRTRVKEQYEVVAPIAGRLLRVSLKAGDSVVADETIIGTVTLSSLVVMWRIFGLDLISLLKMRD